MKRSIIALISLVAFVSSCAKEVALVEDSLSKPVEVSAAPDAAGYLLGFGASAEGTRVSIDLTSGELEFESADEALVYVPATE